MAVVISAPEIDRNEVSVSLTVTMKLKEWKIFNQELPSLPVSTQFKDELLRIFNSIK